MNWNWGSIWVHGIPNAKAGLFHICNMSSSFSYVVLTMHCCRHFVALPSTHCRFLVAFVFRGQTNRGLLFIWLETISQQDPQNVNVDVNYFFVYEPYPIYFYGEVNG